MKKMNELKIKNKIITITGIKDNDYISLTDIAKFKNEYDPNAVIANWLRKVDTLTYLELWEKLNNSNFKPLDFEGFKSKPGENAFSISPKKFIEMVNSIGLRVKSGRYGGGTFAHRDIALHFASWVSPEIELYIIKEFQRLKAKESSEIGWKENRFLSKLNYLIHTEAIKENLIIINLTKKQKDIIYASEADLLNVALFGKTASEWKSENLNKKGNMRDYATSLELSILSNIEFENSKLIEKNIPQKDRLIMLNEEANREKILFNKNQNKIAKNRKVDKIVI